MSIRQKEIMIFYLSYWQIDLKQPSLQMQFVVSNASTCVQPNISKIWKLPVYSTHKYMANTSVWHMLCLTFTANAITYGTCSDSPWPGTMFIVVQESTCFQPNLSQMRKLTIYSSDKNLVQASMWCMHCLTLTTHRFHNGACKHVGST